MKNSFSTFFFIFFLLLHLLTKGQKNSETIITYQKFIAIVKENHPLAKQADLAVEKGEAELLKSRGGFDPKLYGTYNQKQFKGDEYFELFDAGLKVPTWFGISAKVGYESNDGKNLNFENVLPSSGLWYAGVEVALGNGLFMDERRAELKRAKIYRESSIAQQKIMLNDLLYEAGKAYWNWFEAYNGKVVLEEGYTLAKERFEGIKSKALFGDAPIIDTVEGWIQVQNRKIELQQYTLSFQNTAAYLGIFLWKDGFFPMELDTNTIPLLTTKIDIKALSNKFYDKMDSLIKNHPELLQYQYKIETLEINARLMREQLKPDIDINYNALNQPTEATLLNDYSLNDYKWGVNFNFPIALRKQRGDLRLIKIKQNEAQLQMVNKREVLSYKSKKAMNDWNITYSQIEVLQKTVADYLTLLGGEKSKLAAGESSLFMVNRREVNYLKARLKLNNLISKNQKAKLTTKYIYGVMNGDF